MKKLDRFAREVAKVQWTGLSFKDGRQEIKCLDSKKAVNLLRTEHAWMQGIVMRGIRDAETALDAVSRSDEKMYHGGARDGLRKVLAQLTQRKKSGVDKRARGGVKDTQE